MQTFNERKNLYFDIESDFHVSSKNYEESGCRLNLDLLTSLMGRTGG